MNSIVELKDALIANQILRIQSLSREKLVRELVEIRASYIEALSDAATLEYAKGESKN